MVKKDFSKIDLKRLEKQDGLIDINHTKTYRVIDISDPKKLKEIDETIEKLQMNKKNIRKETNKLVKPLYESRFGFSTDQSGIIEKINEIDKKKETDLKILDKKIKKEENKLKNIEITMKEIALAPRQDTEPKTLKEVKALGKKGENVFFEKVEDKYYRYYDIFPSKFNSKWEAQDVEFWLKHFSEDSMKETSENIYKGRNITDFETQLKNGEIREIGGYTKWKGDYQKGYILSENRVSGELEDQVKKGIIVLATEPDKEYILLGIRKKTLYLKEINCDECKPFTKTKELTLPIIDYKPELLKKKKSKKNSNEVRKILIKSNLCVKGTIRREGNNMMCKLNSDVDKLTKKLGNRKKALKQANKVIQSRFIKKK